METIRSIENPSIKRAAKLRDKKYRREVGRYLAEGERLVRDIAGLKKQRLEEIFLSEQYYASHSDLDFSCKTSIVSDIVLNKLSDTKNPQGIVGIVQIPSVEPLSAKRCLYLDRVRDPGNLGTIIRTAAAFGFDDVVCADCADVYAPKTVRSAMSAVAVCNFPQVSLAEIKAGGYTVVCGDMHGMPIDAYSNHSDKLCLVIGNEANGICEELMRLADASICIPMRQMESLNASVGAAILMYILQEA